jgi:hypothetical protein
MNVLLQKLLATVAEFPLISRPRGPRNRPHACSFDTLESRRVLASVPGVSLTGQIQAIDPPATVEVNKLEDNSFGKFFVERTNVKLTAPISTDISKPGIYSQAWSLTPAPLPAGSVINSYYLHFDVVGEPSLPRRVTGTITFAQPVLRIILGTGKQKATDFLGAPTTKYPPSAGRGFDFNDAVYPDSVTLSLDSKTVTIDLQNAAASDDIRIITVAPAQTTAPAQATAPSKLVGVAGNGRVNLSWAAPASDGNATITDYLIQSSADLGRTWTNVSRVASARQTAAISGLQNDKTYCFRVAAVNVAGIGAFSPVSALVIPRKGLQTAIDLTPSANVRLQAIGAGAVGQLPEGDLRLGGVAFRIPAGGANVWSAASAVGPNPRVLDIPVNAVGATKVNALINTLWGETGAGTSASITFIGSAGARHTVNLDGNVNIRNYLWSTYTNTINGTSTRGVFAAGAGQGNLVRLDMQLFTLPRAFARQTLTSIQITDTGATGSQRVIVSGVTVT